MTEERKNVDDPLLRYPAYVKAIELFDFVMEDTDLLIRDSRGEVIMRQIIRSAGSISANFEEGYGQGTTAEFILSLRIANGEARETKGWYKRAKRFLPNELIERRIQHVDEVIALTSSMIGAPLKKKTRG